MNSVETLLTMGNELMKCLGRPVPFAPFLGFSVPLENTNAQKGTLVVIITLNPKPKP